VLLGLGQKVGALDYYRWRGPDLTGISKETGWSTTWPSTGPIVLWKAEVGIGFSSFSVSEGRAFTMGNIAKKTNVVYAFEAATGKSLWKHAYAEPLEAKYYEGGPSATPTVDGDRVYTLSKKGKLHCLEAATGKVVWEKNLAAELNAEVPTWGFAGSLLAADGHLYVNVGKYGTALDKSGKVLWTTGTEAAGYSTHVPFELAGQRGLAVFAAKVVAAVDPKTGRALWSYPWETSYDVNAADPIFQGDQLFISSGYNRGASLVRVTGDKVEKVWENKTMRNHFNSCLLISSHLYGFDEDELKCLEFATGTVKWTQNGLGKGALMAADGKLIVLSEKGELVVAPADPAGFKPAARAQVLGGKCWTTPVLSNGRIYCRNAAGSVVCLDVSGK
jgi:outer membrane protein assembly factor BamB